MKKRWIAMLLCMVMALSTLAGCSGGTDATQAAGTQAAGESGGAGGESAGDEGAGSGEAGSAYRVLYSGEVTTLNYLITATTNDFQISANVIDTLLEYDNKGELLPSLATDWSYDEAANTWTFTLREGQKWVDNTGAAVADVTAQDFVDSMKYILTPSNTSATSQMLFGVIENAEEYYKGLAGEEGYSEIDFSEVGVTAVDEHTLQYKLADQVPYFLSMLTYVCFMPAYGPQLEEQGASFGTTAESMYYCGAYYISNYEPQVQMVLTKNAGNWDAEHVYIETIQRTYNAEEGAIGAEMAKRGEIDYTTLGADIVDAWLADPETSDMVSMERPHIDYNYFYCFNFNVHKLNEDYTTEGMSGYSIDEKYEPANWEIAVNNENFRQSIRHAISRVSTLYISTGDSADPNIYIQNTITPEGFAVNSETGEDYTAQARFADIMGTDSFDTAAAESYKEQAMAELGQAGVTFPVKVLVRYNPTTTNWEEECVVLESQLESVLGTDYIDVIIEAGPAEGFLTEVRRNANYMLLLCNWGADYADPETWTDPFYQAQNADGSYGPGSKYSYMATAITDNQASADTVKEYFRLVEAARAITNDTAARYAAFAEAEAYLIEHALVVPYGTSVSNFVVSRLNPWEGQFAPFGISRFRYKGQKLYDHFISMEEFESFAEQQ